MLSNSEAGMVVNIFGSSTKEAEAGFLSLKPICLHSKFQTSQTLQGDLVSEKQNKMSSEFSIWPIICIHMENI